MGKITKEELLKEILSEERDMVEDEEILDILVREKVSKDITRTSNKKLSFGDKMSDKTGEVCG